LLLFVRAEEDVKKGKRGRSADHFFKICFFSLPSSFLSSSPLQKNNVRAASPWRRRRNSQQRC